MGADEHERMLCDVAKRRPQTQPQDVRGSIEEILLAYALFRPHHVAAVLAVDDAAFLSGLADELQPGDTFELGFELRGELGAEGLTVKNVAGPSVGPFEEHKDAFLLRRAGEGLNLYVGAKSHEGQLTCPIHHTNHNNAVTMFTLFLQRLCI